jgi:Skp family chaperone for outer membrane proteins
VLKVKKPYRWAVLAAAGLLVGYLTSLAVGQGPSRSPVAPPMAGSRIALLDVTRIFKTHARFKSMMEEMKADVQRAENDVKLKRDQITKAVEDLQATYRKGTPEYKNEEERLANAQAKLAVDVQRQKNDFLQREAKIYNTVYQDILQATNYFCKKNAIDVVIKYSGEPADVERPDTVLAKINQQVVWYDPGVDITDFILQDLNRQPAASPAAATRPGVQMPQR